MPQKAKYFLRSETGEDWDLKSQTLKEAIKEAIAWHDYDIEVTERCPYSIYETSDEEDSVYVDHATRREGSYMTTIRYREPDEKKRKAREKLE